MAAPGAIPDFFGTDAKSSLGGFEPATVLFVDDEPRVLAGLKNLLRRYRSTLTPFFANSAEEALEHLASQTFDILVTDIRMPNIDGLELLAHAREHCPGTARVILSGHAPQEAKLMCSPLAHQFLMKPCAPPDLLTAFRRILWAHHLLPDRGLRATLGRFSVFPQSPATARLVRDHQSGLSPSVDMLACACLADITLLARTLRISRFDHFDASAPLDSVMNALHALGNEPVARITESIEEGSAFDSAYQSWFRWADETRHAFDVANRIQKILQQTAPELAHRGALVGLLHDLGRLALLAVYPSTMRVLHDQPGKTNFDEVHRERELLGTDHSQVGAYMLALWGYPEEIVVPVLAQHSSISDYVADEKSLPYAPIVEALRASELDANLEGHAHVCSVVEGAIATTLEENTDADSDAANDSGVLPVGDLNEADYG